MSLEISGKVIQILPLESGEGKTGQQWKKQYFVIEYMDGQYAKKVCIQLWGDKTDILRTLAPGSDVKVSFNVESREYNGRWYTDVKAWKIETGSGAPAASTPSYGSQPASMPVNMDGPDNDLPF